MANTGQQTRGPRGGEGDGDLDSLKADLAALRGDLAGVVQAIKGLGETAVATAKRQQGAAVGRLTAGAEALADEATSVACRKRRSRPTISGGAWRCGQHWC